MKEKTFPRVFRKAIKGAVGGRFLTKRGGQYIEDEFLLKGDPNSTDLDTITVEVPDEEAEKYFLKQNKQAIVNGYLIEISEGYEMQLDEVNAVSDGFLKDLLKQPYTKMKKRVEEFTSPAPITRLLDIALAENKPYKTIDYLKATLAKFNENRAPNIAEVDGVKIGGSTQ